MVQVLPPNYALLANMPQAAPVSQALATYHQAQQDKLLQAQAQAALAKARSPFGGQALTGPAGMAMSDLRFQHQYGSDPTKMQTLQYYKSFQERSQNIRTFQTLTQDERANWFAKGRGMGYSQDELARAFANGYNLDNLVQWKKTGENPLSIAHNAENFNNNKLAVDTQEVQHHARPVKPNEIRLQYPLTAGTETAQQKAVAASAGMDYLSKAITHGLNYGGLFSTVTRPWYWDTRSNDPARQQKAVNYYAAHSLKPELALYRMRIQQGTASARAMKQLTPTIIGDIEPQLKYLSPNIQKRIQNRVREVLEESTRQSSLQALGKTPTISPKTEQVAPVIPTASQQTTQPAKAQPTQENLEFTAKVNNISVDEVKRRLGIK